MENEKIIISKRLLFKILDDYENNGISGETYEELRDIEEWLYE